MSKDNEVREILEGRVRCVGKNRFGCRVYWIKGLGYWLCPMGISLSKRDAKPNTLCVHYLDPSVKAGRSCICCPWNNPDRIKRALYRAATCLYRRGELIYLQTPRHWLNPTQRHVVGHIETVWDSSTGRRFYHARWRLPVIVCKALNRTSLLTSARYPLTVRGQVEARRELDMMVKIVRDEIMDLLGPTPEEILTFHDNCDFLLK